MLVPDVDSTVVAEIDEPGADHVPREGRIVGLFAEVSEHNGDEPIMVDLGGQVG
jgi:hypothetical protein